MQDTSFENTAFQTQWLLQECQAVLVRVSKSGKPQQGLAAGALAGLSAALGATKVGLGAVARENGSGYYLACRIGMPDILLEIQSTGLCLTALNLLSMLSVSAFLSELLE
jgi:hypothetical protein